MDLLAAKSCDTILLCITQLFSHYIIPLKSCTATLFSVIAWIRRIEKVRLDNSPRISAYLERGWGEENFQLIINTENYGNFQGRIRRNVKISGKPSGHEQADSTVTDFLCSRGGSKLMESPQPDRPAAVSVHETHPSHSNVDKSTSFVSWRRSSRTRCEIGAWKLICRSNKANALGVSSNRIENDERVARTVSRPCPPFPPEPALYLPTCLSVCLFF